MLVRLIIDTTHLYLRGIHYEQEKSGDLMRGHILEDRNWKHLNLRQGPELCCMWENILEDSVTGICLVHDEPDNWIVEGAAHGVPEQAGGIDQQVNWCYLKLISILVYVTDFVHIVLGCLHHLDRVHLNEAAKGKCQSRRFKRRVWTLFLT